MSQTSTSVRDKTFDANYDCYLIVTAMFSSWTRLILIFDFMIEHPTLSSLIRYFTFSLFSNFGKQVVRFIERDGRLNEWNHNI